MFESMFSWVLSAVSVALDTVTTLLFQSLSFDINRFADDFTIAPALYRVLQGVGLGLVIGIAIWQLLKFFAGNLSETKDTPVGILVRSSIAIMLILIGNHFLVAIMNLFSYPYADMLALSAVDGYERAFEFSANLATSLIMTASGGAGILIALIGVLMIGYNILKLLLEVAERYLVLMCIVYTSPLGWATCSSATTSGIFQRWIQLFLSQCVMMLMNVWSVKMLISILPGSGGSGDSSSVFLRLVLALAFCKVAQRIDSYLNQIGVTTATTGGHMLVEEMMVVSRAMGGRGNTRAEGTGKDVGERGGILGAFTSGNVLKGGAIAAGVSGARKVGRAVESAIAAKDYAKDAIANTQTAQYVTNAASDMKQSAKDAIAGSAPVSAAKEVSGQAKNALKSLDSKVAGGVLGVTEPISATNSGILNAEKQAKALEEHGAGRFANQNGALSQEAEAAGIVNTGESLSSNNPGALEQFVAANAPSEHLTNQTSQLLANTIAGQSPDFAEKTVMNNQTSGGIKNDQINQAALSTITNNSNIADQPELKGLSEAINGIENAGTISDLQSGNGEISGTYSPPPEQVNLLDEQGQPVLDDNGKQLTEERAVPQSQFSVLSQDAYENLDAKEQEGYKPIETMPSGMVENGGGKMEGMERQETDAKQFYVRMSPVTEGDNTTQRDTLAHGEKQPQTGAPVVSHENSAVNAPAPKIQPSATNTPRQPMHEKTTKQPSNRKNGHRKQK